MENGVSFEMEPVIPIVKDGQNNPVSLAGIQLEEVSNLASLGIGTAKIKRVGFYFSESGQKINGSEDFLVEKILSE